MSKTIHSDISLLARRPSRKQPRAGFHSLSLNTPDNRWYALLTGLCLVALAHEIWLAAHPNAGWQTLLDSLQSAWR